MTQKGRTLITGASGGIGKEFAHVFAKHGHDLIISARGEAKLHELKTELEKKHKIQVSVVTADLGSPTGAQELIKKVKELEVEVDTLINNAGFGLFGDFAKETDWIKEKEMLQVNVMALTELCKAFIPQMLANKRGQILNLASTAAFQPGPLMAIYYASKAYVLHFSEAIAEELSGTGVNVTALCPGPTESGFQAAAAMQDSKLVKGKKMPTARDVAEYGYASLVSGKRVAIHGLGNYLLAQTSRFTPRNIVTKIAKKIQDRA